MSKVHSALSLLHSSSSKEFRLTVVSVTEFLSQLCLDRSSFVGIIGIIIKKTSAVRTYIISYTWFDEDIGFCW